MPFPNRGESLGGRPAEPVPHHRHSESRAISIDAATLRFIRISLAIDDGGETDHPGTRASDIDPEPSLRGAAALRRTAAAVPAHPG